MNYHRFIAVFFFCFLLASCAETLFIAGAATSALLINDRRTAGALIDDQTIETKAAKALKRATPPTQPGHVSVVSFNRSVLLIGQVPNVEAKHKAGEIAQKIQGVIRVINELSVAENISFWDRSKDALLTSQVKTRLLATKQLKSSAFKVVSESGVVYLMGLVSPDEGKRAVDIARTTKGVSKVVHIFEYPKEHIQSPILSEG